MKTYLFIFKLTSSDKINLILYQQIRVRLQIALKLKKKKQNMRIIMLKIFGYLILEIKRFLFYTLHLKKNIVTHKPQPANLVYAK